MSYRMTLFAELGVDIEVARRIAYEAHMFGNIIEPGMFSHASDTHVSDIEAAILVGCFLKTSEYAAAAKKGEGHRSLAGGGDDIGQKIYGRLFELSKDKNFRRYAEEEGTSPRLVDKNNPTALFKGHVTFEDPLDSTLSRTQGLGTYCTANGDMLNGMFVNSIMFAPSLNGGLLITSEMGKGVWEVEGDRKTCRKVSYEPVPISSALLLTGVDTQLYGNVTNLMPRIVPSFRGKLDAPSGLLALGLLAAGRANVVLQTPQKAHDWAPMHRAVTEQGHKFFWFTLEDGKLIPVKAPEEKHFKILPKENRLGFVVGQPDIAERLFSALPRNGWERLNPDTVSGQW